MEKKRFAFIEMETHSALLEQWYLLLKEMSQIEFEFFVHEKVLHKLSSIPKELITVVKSVLEIPVRNFDAVVVNTFHRNFEQYKAVFEQKPTLCLLHNLNFSLFFKGISIRNIFGEKERLTYFLKLYLKENVGSNRKLILKAYRFGVLSKSLQDEVAGKSRYADRTQVVQMNYCQSSTLPSSDTINIVMPGNVSNKRKDFTMLLSVLPKLHPKSKLHFTFLGKPENDIVLGQLESLQKQCDAAIAITHYNQFIPWEEYSRTVAKAHLLLCPIKSETSFYWVDEVYGKTKVSGSEGDCIYNGKIGLFPTSYPKMNWHNLYYKNASDLETILNNLTIAQLSSEYEKLQPYLEQYTFESVKNNLENQLLQLANS
ncbi:hypothetical protein FEDK69T_25090 [Flavobacterium enshiense DK69]|uniref:hypothetical protein n=1 Tax=Flavobacterium enshiense TaxID=1341165 RepID=UPI0003C61ED7|nr:hypothetical protein [Flavobacterium enshiense]ESU21442.1 hypothetical protein FEDK69T_25090 [Flavobacterium enshiense DK69]